MHRFICVLAILSACGDNNNGNRPPAIADLNLTTDEDTQLTRALDATDPDGDQIAFTAGQPAHGTVTTAGGSFTYTPEANFHGVDMFTLTASDGTMSDSAVVSITVNSVNDPPTGVADTFATSEDTPHTTQTSVLLANDSDVDNDTLTITAVGNATNGTVAKSGNDITFTPSLNFTGSSTYRYTLSDGTATTDVTVTLTVGGVNDAPVAVNDARTTAEDMALVVTGASLVANDTDPEGATLSVTAVSNATHGTVALASGMVTYTPDANFNGTATFDYTVSDGSLTDTGTVTVTITPVNDAPVANADTVTTLEDTQLVVMQATMIGNDSDIENDTLTVTGASNPTGGTVTFAGGNVTFTPTANLNGTAAGSFQYTLSDGTDSTTGTVTVNITAVNDAPIAADDIVMTNEDTASVVSTAMLLTNDTDGDSGVLTITGVGNATHGTVALASGNVTFTPDANFNGTATYDYTVSDGALTDTGTVTVMVLPVNDAPVAVDDTATAITGVAKNFATSLFLANDTDLETPAGLSIVSVSNAQNGNVSLAGNTITFTSDVGFLGTASFDYVVSDGFLTDTGTVVVTVAAPPPCGDGAINGSEACDDGNTTSGDGCSDTCQVEAGFSCSNQPSDCAPICGDALVVGGEQCDDGNAIDTDGCTTQCKTGVAFCVPSDFAALFGDQGQDRMAINPANGHCYVAFDDTMLTFNNAQNACLAFGGYLTTITSSAESTVVTSVQNPAQNPWIGAVDDANDTDAVFDWVTDEPFTFTNFAPGQPDDDASFGGNGECLHIVNAAGEWNDTNCTINTFVVGYICELDTTPCGNGVLQTFSGEECDDGNTTANDGCSATCQLEDGCGDGNLDAGEECDDNNLVSGDGCSATCQAEDGCGDGNLDAGEECDDNNVASGDGCSATCQLEDGCGDGNIDAGEECDDNNIASGDGCSATCQLEDGCGDGNIDAGEECDDNNTSSGDGCSATCQAETGCGDGIVEAGEACDDDNKRNFDGCSSTCTVEGGAVCTGTAPTLCSRLIINETDYDQPSNDTIEFVEVYNAGTGPADISNIALVLVNGGSSPPSEYFFDGTTGAANVGKRIALSAATVPSNSLPAGGMIVIGQAAVTSTVPSGVFTITITAPTAGWIQNGAPDAIGLFNLATSLLVDSLAYEGGVTGATLQGVTGTFTFTEGTPGGTDAGNAGAPQSLSRTNAVDTQDNGADFTLQPATPGVR